MGIDIVNDGEFSKVRGFSNMFATGSAASLVRAKGSSA
jgi:hypothetical protein